MRGWLAALRIARREARRARGRSALVVALVGLPVLALSFAAVTYDSFRLTPAQRWEREFGAADAQLSWLFDGPAQQSPDLGANSGDQIREEPVTEAELLAVLPPGGRVVPYRQSSIDMRTATGVGSIIVQGVDMADPIFEGQVVLRDGRAPTTVDEVALTPQAADRLGASTGDVVHTGDAATAYTVVGLVEFTSFMEERMLLLPDAMPDDASPQWFGSQAWLWDAPAPVSWEQVRELNQLGILVVSRAVMLDPPPAAEVELAVPDDQLDPDALSIGILIAGLGLLEVVLLAGPAFAVGARRRQRDLALVAASGGTPTQLRRIMLADGVVLGVCGAVVGIGLGTALALAGRPLLETYLWGARAGGYRFFPLALLGVAGLAVLTGVLAALVPAFIASRQPVVAALAGRRGVVRSRRRWLVLGLVMTGLGVVMAAWGAWRVSTNVVLGGLVVGELGLVLCTPALVGLVARGARFAPLSTRIALRDTARNRAAAAPAISAVMAAVAGGLALGIFLDSDDARQRSEYLAALPAGSAAVLYQWWTESSPEDPGPQRLGPEHHEDVRAAVADGLAARRLLEIATPGCRPDSGFDDCGVQVMLPEQNECPFWQIERELTAGEQRAAAADARCRIRNQYATMQVAGTAVDDGSDVATMGVLTGATADDLAGAAAMLRAGGVVVTEPLLVLDGSVTVLSYQFDLSDPDGGESSEHSLTVPAYVLTTATGPEMTFVPPAVVAQVELDPQVVALVAETTAPPTQAERDALAAALRAVDPNLSLYVEQGPPVRNDPRLLVLAGVAGVVTLGAAGIATGLAAADRRADLSTLGAVGASPRVRRLLALSQSGVIAGMGTLLGVAAGAGAALAVLVALNQRQADVWPPPVPFPIEVPWSTLAVLVVVPVVAMVGAGLLTRSRLPIERRRV